MKDAQLLLPIVDHPCMHARIHACIHPSKMQTTIIICQGNVWLRVSREMLRNYSHQRKPDGWTTKCLTIYKIVVEMALPMLLPLCHEGLWLFLSGDSRNERQEFELTGIKIATSIAAITRIPPNTNGGPGTINYNHKNQL